MTEFVFVSTEELGCALGHVAPGRDVHVRACLDRDEDQRWWACADVLYRESSVSVSHILRQLRDYPGCAVCVGRTEDGRLVVALRRGEQVWILRTRTDVEFNANQCALLGSALHALMVLFGSASL